MTQQTFDPFGSLELPDMLDQAKLALVWRDDWKRILSKTDESQQEARE